MNDDTWCKDLIADRDAANERIKQAMKDNPPSMTDLDIKFLGIGTPYFIRFPDKIIMLYKLDDKYYQQVNGRMVEVELDR
jgi:hypothetical protein